MMDDAPRILLLTDADVFAGTERHMLDLATGLAELGAAVRVGCPSPSPLAEKARGRGIDVAAIPKRGMVDFAAVKRIAAMLRAGEIDIVHAHNGRTHLAAAMAVSRAGRGACVATQHFLSPSRVGRRGPKAWLSTAAHRWVMRRTARFIAISEAVKREATGREPSTAQRTDVVLNGICEPDARALAPAATVRAGLGIEAHTPLVFCAARLQKEKDIGTLVAAMAEVVKRVPGTRCLVAGEGEEKAALEGAIAERGVGKSVTLLGFRSDVLDLMAAADVFVLPSVAEPFGLVLLEAMALGRAVVATRAGGPCEIVEEGATGLLARPRDANDMAAALVRLLEDRALRERCGAAGRQRFAERFTAARMAEETLAVYHAAAGAAVGALAGAAR